MGASSFREIEYGYEPALYMLSIETQALLNIFSPRQNFKQREFMTSTALIFEATNDLRKELGIKPSSHFFVIGMLFGQRASYFYSGVPPHPENGFFLKKKKGEIK